MAIFELFEDQKVSVWRRTYYTLEADSLEEAVELVKAGDEDCDECETIYETEEYLDPCDNDGEATQEIYEKKTLEMLWDNKMN